MDAWDYDRNPVNSPINIRTESNSQPGCQPRKIRRPVNSPINIRTESNSQLGSVILYFPMPCEFSYKYKN